MTMYVYEKIDRLIPIMYSKSKKLKKKQAGTCCLIHCGRSEGWIFGGANAPILSAPPPVVLVVAL